MYNPYRSNCRSIRLKEYDLPREIIPRIMAQRFLVYVLQSVADKGFYVGFTTDLQARLKEHFSGRVSSTKNRLPLRLAYWEGSLDQRDATRREKYLKNARGKRYIKNRLKNYLTG